MMYLICILYHFINIFWRLKAELVNPEHTPNIQYLQQLSTKLVKASCIHVSRLLQIGFGSQPSLQDDRELTFKSTFLPKEAFMQGYIYLLLKDILNMSLYCHLLCKHKLLKINYVNKYL